MLPDGKRLADGCIPGGPHVASIGTDIIASSAWGSGGRIVNVTSTADTTPNDTMSAFRGSARFTTTRFIALSRRSDRP